MDLGFKMAKNESVTEEAAELEHNQGILTSDKDVTRNREGNRVAPDGGWGWCVVFGSFLIHLIMGGFQRADGVIYLELREKFGKSATDTAWVLALFTTVTHCAGPLVSAMCNRLSLRFVAIFGAVLASIGTLLSAFGPNLTFLYFSYGIMAGFGRAMLYVPCLVIVGYYFEKRRGLAVGFATSGAGVGSFFFPPLFEYLFDVYGFRGSFLILSAISTNFLISSILFRPLELNRTLFYRNAEANIRRKDTMKGIGKDSPATKEANSFKIIQQHEQNKQSYIKSMVLNIYHSISTPDVIGDKQKQPSFNFHLFKNYAFTCMCLQLLLFSISFMVTIVFLPALSQSKGLGKKQGAYLVSILGIFDAVSRIAMSSVLDMKNVKRFRLIIYNILMVVIGVLTILLPLMFEFWQFAIITALYGVMTGTYVSQKSVILVDILGVENLSSSFGLLLIFQGTGCLIGPVIGGVLRDVMGSYEMSFYTGSIGIFIGAAVLASGNIWISVNRRN